MRNSWNVKFSGYFERSFISAFSICMTVPLKVFQNLGSNKLINNKTFEHASLMSLGRWQMKSCCIMQNLTLIFSKTNFKLTGVYVKFHSRTIINIFSTRFCSMYRGTLELKNHTSILRKISSIRK